MEAAPFGSAFTPRSLSPPSSSSPPSQSLLCFRFNGARLELKSPRTFSVNAASWGAESDEVSGGDEW
ncbi:hypothetical protein NL676_007023 [Syzygium grande]|nr:hypothetical protein NL676_007023 [Syzygium grande]